MERYITKFKEQGYVILPFTINHRLIDSSVNALDGHYKYYSEHYNNNNRVQDFWKQSKYIKDIACDIRVLDFLRETFGRKFFPFQTLNFEKGSSQRLHSDYYHFAPSKKDYMVGVWVAFEDVHADSGPLMVVPKSHKLPVNFPEDFGIKPGTRKNPYKYYSEYEDGIEEIVKSKKMETKKIALRKGEILVWASNLIHGGSTIINPNLTRKSQVTHYFGTGLRYFTPVLSGKKWYQKKYRLPFDISKGKRSIINLFL